MDTQLLRGIAAGMSLGRIALGVVYLVGPRKEAARWIGDTASRRASTVLTRGLAARDIGLGAGALWALSSDADPRPWFAAQALADSTDVASTLAARESLPATGARLGAVVAGTSALVAAAAALLLED